MCVRRGRADADDQILPPASVLDGIRKVGVPKSQRDGHDSRDRASLARARATTSKVKHEARRWMTRADSERALVSVSLTPLQDERARRSLARHTFMAEVPSAITY